MGIKVEVEHKNFETFKLLDEVNTNSFVVQTKLITFRC